MRPSLEPITLQAKGSKSRRTPKYLQRFLIGGLILAVILIGARFLAIQGWIRPIRIVSGSMADRLIGEHFTVTCADCGFVFKFGVESPPPRNQAVCPNCGFERNIPRPEWRGRGDRVMIDRAAYLLHPLLRFDLVAFRDPRQPVRLVVKRVLGLPAERVSIRRGDLYLNDVLLRKSLSEFSRSAVLVHDNAKLPQLDQTLPSRWRADETESGWTYEGTAFQFRPPSPALSSNSTESDWLTYHHWRCYANPYPRSAEAPVSDNYGYNQGESRELRDVVDLILSCRVRMPSGGELEFRIHDGRQWCTLQLNADNRSVAVVYADHQIATASLEGDPTSPMDIEFGLIDQQIVFAVSGHEVIRQAYDPGNSSFSPRSQPISVGGLGTAIEVSNLRVLRDVFYLDPWAVGQTWSMQAASGTNEYFVLGDNPAISDDSRLWKEPLLSKQQIIGKVISLPR